LGSRPSRLGVEAEPAGGGLLGETRERVEIELDDDARAAHDDRSGAQLARGGAPAQLGEGTPLFDLTGDDARLELVASRGLESGLAQLEYRVFFDTAPCRSRNRGRPNRLRNPGSSARDRVRRSTRIPLKCRLFYDVG
jgi:hypothetical protein